MKAANIIETTCKIASNGYQLLSSAYNVGQKIGKIYYDTQVLGKDLDWGDVAGIGLDVFTGALAGKGISDDLKGFNKVRSAELSTAAADNGFMSGHEIGMDGNLKNSGGSDSFISKSNKSNGVQRYEAPTIGNGKQYSTLYEANTGSGSTRSAHRNAANKQFYNEMANDKNFKRTVDDYFGYDVMDYMKNEKGSFKNPSTDWVWHHPADAPGIIRLIPENQHQSPVLQSLLHPGPNGQGGFGLFN